MTLKKLIVHIGSHKTATTFIQSTLANNAAALDQISVLYPQAGRIYEAHFKLGWTLREKPQAHIEDIDEWATLIDEIKASPAKVAVISSEEFGLFVSPERLEPLKHHFDIFILAYLRSPDSYLQSFYNQFVKDFETRETRNLNTYIAEQPLFFLESRRLIEPWIKVFGRNAVTVRLFEQATKHGNIMEDFFDAIGLRGGLHLSSPQLGILQKVSLPPDALEFVRFSNAHLTQKEGHYQFIVQLVKMALDNKGKLDATSSGILSLNARRTLRKRYAGANRWVANTFLGSDQNPFKPEDAPLPPADFDSRPYEADARILGRVAAMIHNGGSTNPASQT